MTKKLDQALASVRKLPERHQDAVADAILVLAATYEDDGGDIIPEEHQAEIARRFSEPFEPADAEEVKSFFARHEA